jgi:hypothetical protein
LCLRNCAGLVRGFLSDALTCLCSVSLSLRVGYSHLRGVQILRVIVSSRQASMCGWAYLTGIRDWSMLLRYAILVAGLAFFQRASLMTFVWRAYAYTFVSYSVDQGVCLFHSIPKSLVSLSARQRPKDWYSLRCHPCFQVNGK